ncbi:tRNA (adenosine(37)-N6)-threonylcarbamoyltransferase complex ATPase subunit type 1 TsaE [Fulvivirgaceae bacterium PWU4]|uniref:tRNA threonylcarbamoyladenosine biosynthesis protein TsaE n=1 Tax=Chryseosolibacter histidini TaxID=2782349 RepID=A0AAP2DQS6_9BACT|nr:tRNA (adenosine(37)-N6)-threonylcarbamoyltransferase complex ATPase subunit type 1 TsaE [Chryseosolibacter histidini]MBT1700831.1 tRNA (adenosine(37)-N6)-threonylcarbamoyltransferase complex ATPase subunit type 1 TsaE [Chryseosolibacter histidini]
MWCDDGGWVVHEADLADLNKVAKDFIERAGNRRVWLLYGEMGSGKTTFIKDLCSQLGVADVMSSPTFSIVNEYLTRSNTKVFHFDFYRIKNEAEAYDIGAEEYFYSGNYCFVEWPEKIPSLIPSEHVEVSILSENQTHRTLALSVHDGKEKNRI